MNVTRRQFVKGGVAAFAVTFAESARFAGEVETLYLRPEPSGPFAAMTEALAAAFPEHPPYGGVSLTPAGERVALEVIRHHRLLELYLAETLGVHVDDVHDEADRLEHVISEELEGRIDRALGFPTHDPHGDPIPNADLEWPGDDLEPVSK